MHVHRKSGSVCHIPTVGNLSTNFEKMLCRLKNVVMARIQPPSTILLSTSES